MTKRLTAANVRKRYEACDQSHVFTFFDDLSPKEQEVFLEELNEVDIEHISKVAKQTLRTKAITRPTNAESLPDNAIVSLPNVKPEVTQQWYELGIDLIRQSKVAVILMAGGQGTRLGSNLPKGCFDIGLPSGKSLFQLQAERILRLQNLATLDATSKAVIPWYIMTSAPTHETTVQFFSDHHYFGISPDQVHFFRQGVIPAFTADGKIMLQNKGKLAMAPDGNGGIYQALFKEKVIESLTERGILYSHCYCVDNCLAHVADPVFLGYCASRGTDCGVKVVSKRSPDEPVGVVCLRNGQYGVVEYSEIPMDVSQQRDPVTGELVFDAANIANHLFSTEFLKCVPMFESSLEYHVANKNIPTIDLVTGEPTKVKGIKLERFVFDVFPYSQEFNVLRVDRSNEFSPLKNGAGATTDCPETSRRDVLRQHQRFIEQAGGKVEDGVVIEISPLVSYNGEHLETLKDRTFNRSTVITSLDDL